MKRGSTHALKVHKDHYNKVPVRFHRSLESMISVESECVSLCDFGTNYWVSPVTQDIVSSVAF